MKCLTTQPGDDHGDRRRGRPRGRRLRRRADASGRSSCRSPSSSSGPTMVNGTYVLRRLLIVIPTLVLVTAFTFWLQNSRGDKRDLAFNILGPGATEAGVDEDRQGVPPRRADAHPLPAVAERRPPRRPRPLGDPGPGGLDGDRQGHPGDAAADALRPDPRPVIAVPARGLRGLPGQPPRRPHRQHGRRSPACRSRTSCWPRARSCSSPSAGSVGLRPPGRRRVPAGVALRALRGGARSSTSSTWRCRRSPWRSAWRPRTCASCART